MWRQESLDDFYEYNTPVGRYTLFCSRISRLWVPVTIGLTLLGVTGYLYLLRGPSEIQRQEPNLAVSILRNTLNSPKYETDFTHGKLSVIGEGDFGGVGAELAISDLTLPSANLTHLRHIEFRNVLIDARLLSLALRNHTNLLSIKLDRVWLVGDFLPVHLPNLNDFYLNLIRNDKTDTYKPEIPLKSLIFFELLPDLKWDVQKNLLNIPVTLHLSLGGTTIIDVARDLGRINLNIHYCHELLQNLQETGFPPVTDLTLSWCSIQPSDIPSTLKYLNLNNAVPPTPQLELILRKLPNLIEFHGFLPPNPNQVGDIWNIHKGPTHIQLNWLYPSLKTLSLANVGLAFPKSCSSLTLSLNELALENSLHSNDIESTDLKTCLNHLSRIAIFQFSKIDSSSILLEKLLTIPSLEWILIEGLNRNSSEGLLEAKLNEIGAPNDCQNFKLDVDKNIENMTFNVSPLTTYEKNYYRYTLLGFDQIDTYEDYVIWDIK